MLTDKQKVLKRDLEKEIRELEDLIGIAKTKGYGLSTIGLMISSKILKKERLDDLRRYE